MPSARSRWRLAAVLAILCLAAFGGVPPGCSAGEVVGSQGPPAAADTYANRGDGQAGEDQGVQVETVAAEGRGGKASSEGVQKQAVAEGGSHDGVERQGGQSVNSGAVPEAAGGEAHRAAALNGDANQIAGGEVGQQGFQRNSTEGNETGHSADAIVESVEGSDADTLREGRPDDAAAGSASAAANSSSEEEAASAIGLVSVQHSPECAQACLAETCNGHGSCGGSPCKCICTNGYSGDYCEEKVPVVANFRLRRPSKPCPDNCGGQGQCLHNGTCLCDRGWAGYNCSLECSGGAANPCSGHGTCNMTDGKCLCDEGFAGRNCTRRSVPTNVNEYRANVLGIKLNEEVPKQLTAEAAFIALQEHLGDQPNQQSSDSNKSVEVAASKGVNGTNTSKADSAVPEKPSPAKQWPQGVVVEKQKLSSYGVNHAAFDLGSKALASNKEAKGEASLLRNDRDKYWISPCKVDKGVLWVVIELSEIIHVQTVVLGSFEYYSSTPKAFQVLGGLMYPTEEWQVLGQFVATATRQYQEFKLHTPVMAKYLKFRLLSHHGSEFYCTLSSIRVYGRTQWEEMGRMLDANEEVVEEAKRRLDGKASQAETESDKTDVEEQGLVVIDDGNSTNTSVSVEDAGGVQVLAQGDEAQETVVENSSIGFFAKLANFVNIPAVNLQAVSIPLLVGGDDNNTNLTVVVNASSPDASGTGANLVVADGSTTVGDGNNQTCERGECQSGPGEVHDSHDVDDVQVSAEASTKSDSNGDSNESAVIVTATAPVVFANVLNSSLQLDGENQTAIASADLQNSTAPPVHQHVAQGSTVDGSKANEAAAQGTSASAVDAAAAAAAAAADADAAAASSGDAVDDVSKAAAVNSAGLGIHNVEVVGAVDESNAGHVAGDEQRNLPAKQQAPLAEDSVQMNESQSKSATPNEDAARAVDQGASKDTVMLKTPDGGGGGGVGGGVENVDGNAASASSSSSSPSSSSSAFSRQRQLAASTQDALADAGTVNEDGREQEQRSTVGGGDAGINEPVDDGGSETNRGGGSLTAAIVKSVDSNQTEAGAASAQNDAAKANEGGVGHEAGGLGDQVQPGADDGGVSDVDRGKHQAQSSWAAPAVNATDSGLKDSSVSGQSAGNATDLSCPNSSKAAGATDGASTDVLGEGGGSGDDAAAAAAQGDGNASTSLSGNTTLGDGEGGDSGQDESKRRGEEEEKRKAEQARKEDEERLAIEAETRKKEEEGRRKETEAQMKKAMGVISAPKGEMSFFQKVPSKIKDLEVNQALLQSYVQDIKKHYDEAFEDVQSESAGLKGDVEKVREKLKESLAELKDRVDALAEGAKKIGAAHQEQLLAIEALTVKLELSAKAQGTGRWRVYAEFWVMLLLALLFARHCKPRLKKLLSKWDAILSSLARRVRIHSRRLPVGSSMAKSLVTLAKSLDPPSSEKRDKHMASFKAAASSSAANAPASSDFSRAPSVDFLQTENAPNSRKLSNADDAAKNDAVAARSAGGTSAARKFFEAGAGGSEMIRSPNRPAGGSQTAHVRSTSWSSDAALAGSRAASKRLKRSKSTALPSQYDQASLDGAEPPAFGSERHGSMPRPEMIEVGNEADHASSGESPYSLESPDNRSSATSVVSFRQPMSANSANSRGGGVAKQVSGLRTQSSPNKQHTAGYLGGSDETGGDSNSPSRNGQRRHSGDGGNLSIHDLATTVGSSSDDSSLQLSDFKPARRAPWARGGKGRSVSMQDVRRHASSTPAWLEAKSSAGGRYGLLAFTEESASETDGAPDSPLKKISSPPDAPDLPHLSLSAGPAAGHRARSCHFE